MTLISLDVPGNSAVFVFGLLTLFGILVELVDGNDKTFEGAD